RRRHTRFSRDWSSDVCSSDLLDVQMVDWLRAYGLPHTVIATKHDKVKSKGRDKRKKDLANGLDLDKGDVVWVSAARGVNVERVQVGRASCREREKGRAGRGRR